MIPFPELRTYRVTLRLPMLAVCLLGAAVVLPSSRWVAVGLAVLAIVIAWPMIFIEVGNAWRRRQWARGFARRLRPSEIVEFVGLRQEPCRMIVQEYTGFGMNQVRPAAVLELPQSGEWLVIWPSPRDPYQLASEAELEVRHTS